MYCKGSGARTPQPLPQKNNHLFYDKQKFSTGLKIRSFQINKFSANRYQCLREKCSAELLAPLRYSYTKAYKKSLEMSIPTKIQKQADR